MTPVEQNIGFFNVGTTFDVVLPILRNDCDYFVSDVEVALTIPPGLEVDSYVIPKGEYLNGVWTAGGLTPGQYAEATFTFIVIDPCENPTSIQFSISAASVCDDCFTITDYEVRISGISCCQVRACLIHGSESDTTDGSGDINVVFDTAMTALPTSILITGTGTTPYIFSVVSRSTSGFTVRVFDVTGNAVLSTLVDFDWEAIE